MSRPLKKPLILKRPIQLKLPPQRDAAADLLRKWSAPLGERLDDENLVTEVSIAALRSTPSIVLEALRKNHCLLLTDSNLGVAVVVPSPLSELGVSGRPGQIIPLRLFQTKPATCMRILGAFVGDLRGGRNEFIGVIVPLVGLLLGKSNGPAWTDDMPLVLTLPAKTSLFPQTDNNVDNILNAILKELKVHTRRLDALIEVKEDK